MSVFQAVLLGLCAFLISTPLTGGQWNQIATKPLICAFVCGIVMMNMKAAMEIGVVLQAMYLGVMVVGGVASMPTINICAWFIIPVCIATGQGADIAVVLAAAFGTMETVFRTLQQQVELVSVHYADKKIAQGDVKGAYWAVMTGYGWRFLFYFFPVVIMCLVGQEVIIAVADALPAWVSSILSIFVAFCPLVGFSLLLRGLISNESQWIFVLVGFTLFKILGMSIISITIIGCAIAYIVFVCSSTGKESA